VILHGGQVSLDLVEAEGKWFSVNGLASAGEERDLLEQDFRAPFVNHPEVQSQYQRFLDTSRWALGLLGQSARSSDELIRMAYHRAVESRVDGVQEVELAWAEYEVRRRVHFALELLLSALTDTLAGLREGTIAQVVEEWAAGAAVAQAVRDVLPLDSSPMLLALREVEAKLAEQAFLEHPPSLRTARDLSPADRALYALSLLLACARQAGEHRSRWPMTKADHYLDQTFQRLLACRNRPVSECLAGLLTWVVVEPHLTTTLRKMSQGQKCSLRCYPEGELLRPTGIAVRAGYSGDRLGNVLGMWADMGCLNRLGGGQYSITDRGQQLLREFAQ
jgi:hypothetical protein